MIRAKSEICTLVEHHLRRIRHTVESRVRNVRHELRHLTSSDRLGLLPRKIAARRERLNRNRVSLYRIVETRARALRVRLAAAERPLAHVPSRVARERHRFDATIATLSAVSPLSVLSRGYAIAFSRTRRGRKPILDSNAVGVGDPIELQLKRGALSCTVDAKTLGIETTWPGLAAATDAPDRK